MVQRTLTSYKNQITKREHFAPFFWLHEPFSFLAIFINT